MTIWNSKNYRVLCKLQKHLWVLHASPIPHGTSTRLFSWLEVYRDPPAMPFCPYWIANSVSKTHRPEQYNCCYPNIVRILERCLSSRLSRSNSILAQMLYLLHQTLDAHIVFSRLVQVRTMLTSRYASRTVTHVSLGSVSVLICFPVLQILSSKQFPKLSPLFTPLPWGCFILIINQSKGESPHKYQRQPSAKTLRPVIVSYSPSAITWQLTFLSSPSSTFSYSVSFSGKLQFAG